MNPEEKAIQTYLEKEKNSRDLREHNFRNVLSASFPNAVYLGDFKASYGDLIIERSKYSDYSVDIVGEKSERWNGLTHETDIGSYFLEKQKKSGKESLFTKLRRKIKSLF